MLRNAKELKNYVLRATDGEIGRLKDFYFDDRGWTVRYIVADAGKWLGGRRVLIAPEPLGRAEWDEPVFPVALTKEQMRNCPGVDTALPITREKETVLRSYYGWPTYFETGYVPPSPPAEPRPPADPHLFSSNKTTGYQLESRDGDLGHVADMLIDEITWAVAYLLVDTRRWLPGRHVLLAPEWVTEVDWKRGISGRSRPGARPRAVRPTTRPAR